MRGWVLWSVLSADRESWSSCLRQVWTVWVLCVILVSPCAARVAVYVGARSGPFCSDTACGVQVLRPFVISSVDGAGVDTSQPTLSSPVRQLSGHHLTSPPPTVQYALHAASLSYHTRTHTVPTPSSYRISPIRPLASSPIRHAASSYATHPPTLGGLAASPADRLSDRPGTDHVVEPGVDRFSRHLTAPNPPPPPSSTALYTSPSPSSSPDGTLRKGECSNTGCMLRVACCIVVGC